VLCVTSVICRLNAVAAMEQVIRADGTSLLLQRRTYLSISICRRLIKRDNVNQGEQLILRRQRFDWIHALRRAIS
jgi:hypothetical protein